MVCFFFNTFLPINDPCIFLASFGHYSPQQPAYNPYYNNNNNNNNNPDSQHFDSYPILPEGEINKLKQYSIHFLMFIVLSQSQRRQPQQGRSIQLYIHNIIQYTGVSISVRTRITSLQLSSLSYRNRANKFVISIILISSSI